MTVIRPNSISGVTSITAHGGDITYFKSDGTRGNQFTHNVSSTGVITATKFVGPIEGNLSNGTINAASGTITGNLNVGGVLTYEDVTNVDSVGVITARSGIRIGATGANTLISGTATGIGIGTDNPSANYRVTIKSSTSPHSALLLDTSESNYNTNLYFAKQATNKWIIGNKASDDAFRFVSGSDERLRIGSAGQLGIGGANYGTDGQVLTSKGASAAIQWATISTGRPIPTRNLRYVINFDYPDNTNASDYVKREMVTPFLNGLSIYSNSGNPFQYMHKTGGLDGGPRYSNTGSVGSNYLKYETGSLLSVKETRACWYKSNSNGGQSLSGGSHSPGVVLWGDTRNSVYGGLGIRNGLPTATTNSNAHYNASTSVNDGNWHHIAFVTDGPGTNIKIYVDGTLEKNENSPNWTSSTQADHIGGHYAYNNTASPDNMANVVLYDRLLTQTEIQALIDARELYRGTIFTGSN